MRISRSGWAKWAQAAQKCLNIGSHCTLCARNCAADADICIACESQFRVCHRFSDRLGTITSLCMNCGEEHPADHPRHALRSMAARFEPQTGSRASADDAPHNRQSCCDACLPLASQPLLHRIIAPYRYTHPVDQLIKRIKYREDRQLARVLGTLLGKAAAQHADGSLPQLLLPMPLHASRLTHRGYNQAADLARWAGRYVDIPVAAGQVSRVVDTGSLAGLSRQERQHRILGAFRASDALAGKHVAIIDDVLTTGASARELAREIYDCGAESVDLWVLARTSRVRSGV